MDNNEYEEIIECEQCESHKALTAIIEIVLEFLVPHLMEGNKDEVALANMIVKVFGSGDNDNGNQN